MSSPLLPQESLTGIDLPCNKRKYIRTRILVSVDEELERYFGTAASYHSISSILLWLLLSLCCTSSSSAPPFLWNSKLDVQLVSKKRTFTRQSVPVGLNFVYLNLSPTHVAFPYIVNKRIKKVPTEGKTGSPSCFLF